MYYDTIYLTAIG